jgi:RimJ/RimL family protein N-acetyltransferase
MLTGELITLRPVKMEDWSETVKWRNNLFIKSSTMSHPFPVTDELEKEWYEKVTSSKEDARILGYFSLNNINWISRNGFVSGAIGENQNMGKGLGQEAVALLLKYAFETLNLRKICAYVRTDHPAMKTWLSMGAILEGTLCRHFYSEGAYHDVAFISWFGEHK